MKKIFLLSIFSLLLSTNTCAGIINLKFTPDTQTAFVGDTVTVDIWIDNFDATESVSAFEVDIMFDESIVSFSQFTFGHTDGFSQLDLFGFGSLQDQSYANGVLSLAELSFDLPIDLLDFQLNRFMLGSMEFSAQAVGQTFLEFSNILLLDQNNDPANAITSFQVSSGEINVINQKATAVPEPSSVLLYLFGLAWFLIRLKRLPNAVFQ